MRRLGLPLHRIGLALLRPGRPLRPLLLFPLTFPFLGQFGGSDMKPGRRSTSTTRFYSWFLLGLGLVFQIPVVIFVSPASAS